MAPIFQFVPPPLGGLNLRVSPYDIAPNEAIQLDNYLIFDSGIRECGEFGSVTQPASGNVGQQVFFKDQTGTAAELICVANKVYRSTVDNWGTPTDLTGALTITSNAWRFAFFKRCIFLVNGTDLGLIYDIAAGTLANDGFTGTTTDNMSQVWVYKQRVYFIKKNSTLLYYGPVSSIAGAVTSFDVGEFLESYGTLLFGCSWSVNQGNSNEQLTVLVTDSGEVLIYSGDYPAAANWQMITRVTIPQPIGNQAFVRLGQDVLIVTVLGVISLAAIVSANFENDTYYNVSIKLGSSFTASNIPPIRDPRQPFIYFASSNSQYINVLNFERGAWSRIDTRLESQTITAMSYWDTGTTGQFLIVSYSNGTTKRMDDLNGTNTNHVWSGGFISPAPDKKKQMVSLRVYGRRLAGASIFRNVAIVRPDYLDASGALPADTKSTDTSALPTPSPTGYGFIMQTLSPPAIGNRFALHFSKTGTGELNEITGVDMFYNFSDIL